MKNKPNPFLIGLLGMLLVCLSGCVSSSKYEDLRTKFTTYVDADKQQLKSFKLFIANETKKHPEGKAPARLKLQDKSADSWQDRQDKADKYLKGLNQ